MSETDASDRGLQIGFVLFPNLLNLDFAGPWDVLANLPGATLHVVAKDLAPIVSSSGLSILPTITFANCPQLDLICVPGGAGHLDAMEDEATLDFLRQQEPGCRFLTSVCTGALVLAAAGLLEGYEATTHWNSHDRLAAYGAIPKQGRVVVDRNRITGGGVTAGIDFALQVIAELKGQDAAEFTQLVLEYDPQPTMTSGHPRTARPEITAQVEGLWGRTAEAVRVANAHMQRRVQTRPAVPA